MQVYFESIKLQIFIIIDAPSFSFPFNVILEMICKREHANLLFKHTKYRLCQNQCVYQSEGTNQGDSNTAREEQWFDGVIEKEQRREKLSNEYSTLAVVDLLVEVTIINTYFTLS